MEFSFCDPIIGRGRGRRILETQSLANLKTQWETVWKNEAEGNRRTTNIDLHIGMHGHIQPQTHGYTTHTVATTTTKNNNKKRFPVTIEVPETGKGSTEHKWTVSLSLQLACQWTFTEAWARG